MPDPDLRASTINSATVNVNMRPPAINLGSMDTKDSVIVDVEATPACQLLYNVASIIHRLPRQAFLGEESWPREAIW